MLGFGSTGSFQHTFKRWTGLAVGEHRRRIIEKRRQRMLQSPLQLPATVMTRPA